MKNHQSVKRYWPAVVSCIVGCSLISPSAQAKPKVTYSVENTIEIKQSSNGWSRPAQEYISVEPHTKAVRKDRPPAKKGEYEVHVVYPSKGPLAIRVPPPINSRRGRLLNAMESSSSSSTAVKKDASNKLESAGAQRSRAKATTVSNTVQEQSSAKAATYEDNYGQPRKRKY